MNQYIDKMHSVVLYSFLEWDAQSVVSTHSWNGMGHPRQARHKLNSETDELEVLQAQLSEATQRAEALSAELEASHGEARKTCQEAEQHVAELQQQLQEQLLAAGSLTEQVSDAEQLSAQVSIQFPLLQLCMKQYPTMV